MDNLDFQAFKAGLLDAIFADPNKMFSGEIYAPFRWDDRFKGGTWVSQKHSDGRPSATGRGVYIADGHNDKHCMIVDENGGFSVEIFTFWEQKTGEKIPYCPQLCELYGIATPTDFAERAAQLKQQRDETQQLLADIKADYLGTAGQAVRAYAQRPIEQGGRGWDADTTNAMADYWGVITPATAARLAQLTGLKFADNIADTHPIVIWSLSNENTLQYAKFRCIGSEKTGADKWRNPTGAARNNVSLYNENNIDWDIETIVVVESEICAARATVADCKNFVAVRGSDGLPSERVRLWWGKGCRKIILLFDTETTAKKQQDMHNKINRAIKNIRSGCADMKIGIAHIPDELNAKDIDELLSGHSDGKELLGKVLWGATVPAWQWNADGYSERYKAATTQNDRDDITFEIIQYALELKEGGGRSTLDADKLLEYYQKTTGATTSSDTLKYAAERQAENERQRKYDEHRKRLFEQLKHTPADNFQQQNEIISQLNALQPPSADSETQYYGLTMEQAFAELYRDASADITTKYNLLYKGHGGEFETLPVVLYSNGITYFAGGTSHGKSTILQNIAYDLLLQGKRVLYYGFEEIKRDTLFELINIHIHKAIPDALNLSQMGSNAGINAYFGTGNPAIFDGRKTNHGKTADLDDNDREKIVKAIHEFLKQYRGVDGGDRLLYVYDDNLTSAELLEHIKNRQGVVRPDAIFVDYVQFLKSESNTKTAQWEDLGEVSKDLISINKASGVPVVVAAQLNERTQAIEKTRPDLLNITNIFGSSSIAQGASAVYIIANSQRYENGVIIDYNNNAETPFGQQHKMLVKLAKNRFGACPAWGLFDYDGAQRYINPDTLHTSETIDNDFIF